MNFSHLDSNLMCLSLFYILIVITQVMDISEDLDQQLQKRPKGAKKRARNDKNEIVKDKWRLLPMFLKVRGLMSQHIQSYDYLINQDLKNIVLNPVNREVRSTVNSNFFLRYENVYVGDPEIEEDNGKSSVTPQICRLRDLTYSAPIFVDVKYSKVFGKRLVVHTKNKVCIGKIPVMLKSVNCVLRDKTESEVAKLQECPHDPGGYFIVKGSEKVILIQEQQSKNKILVQVDTNNNAYADVQSSTHEAKSRTYVCVKKDKLYMRHNSFVEDLPLVVVFKAMDVQSDVMIFRTIGYNSTSVNEVESKVQGEGLRLLSNSFEEAARLGIVTTDQALEYISKKVRRFQSPKFYKPKSRSTAHMVNDTRDILADYVLNHVKVKKDGQYDFRPKNSMLGLMTREVLRAQVDRSFIHDRDYYGNKRLELAGQLLSLLFEDLFKRFNSELLKESDKILNKPKQAETFDMLRKISSYRLITGGFINAISTGNWVLKRFRMERHGVTQQLSRLSYIGALGHLTRMNSQFEKTRKISGPRALQPSQWGNVCLADTPEGQSCGLVKNLALLCHVTSEGKVSNVKKLCYTLGVKPIEMCTGEEVYKVENFNSSAENRKKKDFYVGSFKAGNFVVILNGQLIGTHQHPVKFATQFRKQRRGRRINEFVSVFVNTQRRLILISSDGGRVCRPLIIVDQKRKRGRITEKHLELLSKAQEKDKSENKNCFYVRKLFNQLLSKGYIEYLDVNETNNTLIALKEEDVTDETTHLEIDPLTILGILAGLIPFPHHNQSPRNTYQCAMGKQSMGFMGYNQFKRFDSLLYNLTYSQKPLVKTRTLDLINFDQISSGTNAIIAVMSFTGYDIEDAIILNKASLDRGFGRCMALKTFKTSKRVSSIGLGDMFTRPTGKPKKSEAAIESDGIIGEGQRIKPGYKLVNKLVADESDPQNQIGFGQLQADDGTSVSIAYKPQPLKYVGPKSASIDKVMLTSSDKEQYVCKIRVRDVRRPELGDKFSSRHGQKGVCGLIVNQVDMPFSDTGICPDLIMNPHGFPSRMTVGKMLELVCGKAALFDGKFKYGTAFSGEKVEDVKEILRANGFSDTGKDMLTSGMTGESLEAYVFMGPVYYQKLKHMVVDKMHARPRGPIALLTRQPTDGRSRAGGLRVGEMERDCLVAYGSSALLIERLMVSSDQFEATFCTQCGKLAQPKLCCLCNTSDRLTKIKMPYACKLMFQELESMNIVPRIKFSSSS